jgi:hypothetical protein
MPTLNQVLDARENLWYAIQNISTHITETNNLFLLPLKRKFNTIFDEYNAQTNTPNLIDDERSALEFREYIKYLLENSLTTNEFDDYEYILDAMFIEHEDTYSDDSDSDDTINEIYNLTGIYFEEWLTYAITTLLPNIESDSDSDSDSTSEHSNPNAN